VSTDTALIGIKELQMLAAIERQMDAGEVPWVRVDGSSHRATIRAEIMDALGLVTGQTISWFLFGEILKINLGMLQEDIAKEQARRLVAEEGEG